MLKGADTAAADAIDACQWQIGVRAFRLQSGCSFAFVPPPKGPRSSYFPMRRGAGVVERDGLENRCTGNRTVGSNPTLSAKFYCRLRDLAHTVSATNNVSMNASFVAEVQSNES
jgi:hypothetical protein